MMAKTGRPTVAVVNHDAALLGMIEIILTMDRYRVVASDGARPAYPLIRDTSPGLVILDVPAWNGPDWQLLDRLKHDQETASIPVLVCSASPELRAAEARLRELGCDALEMPFEIDNLLGKVRRLSADVVGADRPARARAATEPVLSLP